MTTSRDHANHVANSPLLRDTLLQDRYRIVKELGRGGMGAVYEAVDQRLGITVALKETLSAEPSMRKQFEHEARLLASMHHPALPRVSDHFVEGSRAFLVMQFIGGVDLARIISQQPGPFSSDQVIVWADQLLDALIYLHSRDRQVIHRDIKPHNLKLTGTGQIALLDFGLAKAQPADTSITSSRPFFGYTKHYAPLEQIQDQRTDPRSDIYALGATLYHLLTGTKPTDALVRASSLVNSEPDPLKPANKINPAVGPEIAAILQKAMAQNSEERYATAADFREALRKVGKPADDPQQAKPVGMESVADTGITRVQRYQGAEINLAMVASARHFGPGGLTAVVLAVCAVAAGVIYASPKWLDSVPAVTTPATRIAAPVGLTATRKVERSRPSPQPTAAPAKTKTQFESAITEKIAGKKESAAKPTPKPVVDDTKKEPRVRRKIGAPSIRLPDPNVGEPTATLKPGTRPLMTLPFSGQ
ncbi:MAG TPA: serine/threonine-protein kinase [Pyrinomonadaceae bacterium]|nr:serine/threonine-protein kinase [Pyrinomonadaceae bacterium]